MAFDLSTARPVQNQKRSTGRFDINTARAVQQPVQQSVQQAPQDIGTSAQPSGDLPVVPDFQQVGNPNFDPALNQSQPVQQPQPSSSVGDVLAEGASAINRGVTQVADIIPNAALAAVGSETRNPITNFLSPATQGGQMQPGLARDVVRSAGEAVGPGAAIGGAVRAGVKSLPAFTQGESALVGTVRSLGAGTTAGGDIAASAASGAGSELGEEVGGTAGAVAGGALAPTAVLGLKNLATKFRTAAPLFDSSDLPTASFKKALDKRNLDVSDIADDVGRLPPNLAPKDADELVDAIVKNKIATGDASPAVAEIRLANPVTIPKSQRGVFKPGEFLPDRKIVPDHLGKRATAVGFSPGDVASAKGADGPTRRHMGRMLNVHRAIFRDSSKATKFQRPINIAGKLVQQRVDLVMNRADGLRNQLDDIANRALASKSVDFDSLEQKVIDDITNIKGLRVKLPDDLPRDVTSIKNYLSKKEAFVGSKIKEDATSQRMIRKTLSILEDAKDGNAQNTHFVKRQIDAFLDDVFGSKPGLKNSGLNFAAKVRRYSNEAVRDIDPEYKAVNEDLSAALDMKDAVVKTITKRVDLNDTDLSEAVIGNELRKLLSNYRVGPEINKTLAKIDAVAAKFGAARQLGEDFEVDVQRLALFSNTLDNRFGPVAAPRSFKGETAAGTKLGVIDAAVETASDAAISPALATAKGAKKALKAVTRKKENDLEAYDAMQKLIKRGK